jgi:hypothetical protein
MFSYHYQQVRGHLILDVEGQPCLFDTGTPFSLGDESIRLGHSEFELHDNYLGVTTADISEQLGCTIEAVLGADVTQALNITINPQLRTIGFCKAPSEGAILIPMRQFMGIPILTISIEGQLLRVLLDTGAQLSYLPREVLQLHQAAGNRVDVYPLLGSFHTDVYNLPLTLGGQSLMLEFGEPPEQLRVMLEVANVDGILGADFLDHFTTSISVRDQALKLEPRSSEALRLSA